MAFNGSGTFSRLYSWITDKANGVFITASKMDAEMDGFATGLSNCITRDGQSPATADIPLGGYKITGLADGTQATDAMAYGQFTTKTHLQVVKSGDQTLADGSLTKIITWTLKLDAADEWVPASASWTCGATGTYLVIATMRADSLTAEAIRFGMVKDAGVAFDGNIPAGSLVFAGGTAAHGTIHAVFAATAGEEFYLAALDGTADCVIDATYTALTIIRVG